MRIAVTGGSGFVGRHLLSELLSHGHEIIALSRRSADVLPQVAGLHWLKGELGNQHDARELVETAEVVIHAALSRQGPSFLSVPQDPLAYWHENATGSLQLLEAARRSSASRFIFLSSGAVHDQVVAPLNEEHPLRPSTLYGACKASVETLIHAFGRGDDLVTTTLRPTVVYGESDPLECSRWFSLVEQVLSGGKVTATGGAKSVHASDVAKAVTVLLHADAPAIDGETFNCCDRMISDFEVAALAKSLCHSDAELDGQPKQAKHEIDTAKLRDLGMQFGGDELLQRTVQSFIDHLRAH
ncbi:MAG: NAD(P)-dependent oxidoreductase [Planctomycetota bacterium]